VVGRRIGDVMDEVLVVGVGKLLGCSVINLRKDEGGEGGGL